MWNCCSIRLEVFSPYGGVVLALLTAMVALTTIGGMLLLIYLTMIGYKRIHSHWLEENERIVIGTTLLVLGVFVLLSHGFA